MDEDCQRVEGQEARQLDKGQLMKKWKKCPYSSTAFSHPPLLTSVPTHFLAYPVTMMNRLSSHHEHPFHSYSKSHPSHLLKENTFRIPFPA